MDARHLTTNPEKPLDRRVRRTRQAIKESLISLMETKPLSEVTVKEVMERADVNRATFYAHFSNLEDLERSIEVDIANKVIFDVEREVDAQDMSVSGLSPVFSRLLGDRDACTWLVGPQSSGYGKQVLCAHAREKCVRIWVSRGMAREKAECLFDFAFDGAFGVLAHWLAEDRDPESTLQTLSDIVRATLTYAKA